MGNPKYFVLLVLYTIFYTSCSPDNNDPVSPTIVDNVDNKEDNTNIPPKPLIIKKSKTTDLTNFKIDLNSASSFYLGSVWSLGDTSKGFELTHLPDKEKSDKIYFLTNSFTADLETHIPSYQTMFSYAKKFKPGSNNLSFSSDTFFDYGIIQYYLANSDDYKAIKDLVAINDSTYIRKKNGISRYAKLEYLDIYTDIQEIHTLYDQEYLQELKNENIDPYYISSVTYGNESIFLAESDSTRQAFNKVFDKLIENSALDNADIAVLDASNLLIYRRDSGSNTSFIKFGKGASQIHDFIKEFIVLDKQNANAVNYPLSFTMYKLSDMSTLKYKLNYDIFEKVEQ